MNIELTWSNNFIGVTGYNIKSSLISPVTSPTHSIYDVATNSTYGSYIHSTCSVMPGEIYKYIISCTHSLGVGTDNVEIAIPSDYYPDTKDVLINLVADESYLFNLSYSTNDVTYIMIYKNVKITSDGFMIKVPRCTKHIKIEGYSPYCDIYSDILHLKEYRDPTPMPIPEVTPPATTVRLDFELPLNNDQRIVDLIATQLSGDVILTYEYQYRVGQSLDWLSLFTGGDDYTHTLSNYNTYHYRVRSVAPTISNWSNVISHVYPAPLESKKASIRMIIMAYYNQNFGSEGSGYIDVSTGPETLRFKLADFNQMNSYGDDNSIHQDKFLYEKTIEFSFIQYTGNTFVIPALQIYKPDWVFEQGQNKPGYASTEGYTINPDINKEYNEQSIRTILTFKNGAATHSNVTGPVTIWIM